MTEPNPHHLTPLPDCMMPDGAEPCRGYSVMLDAAVQAGIRNATLQLEINRLVERCAATAERICREHADPKAGHAAATAIRSLALSSHQGNCK